MNFLDHAAGSLTRDAMPRHNGKNQTLIVVPSSTQMQAGMESCVAKSVLAGGAGFVLGGAFGLFMSSVCYARSPTPLLLRLRSRTALHRTD
jgi:hypothetical protein